MRSAMLAGWLPGMLGAAAAAGAESAPATASPRATIVETRVITQQPTLYHGWPTVARRAGGPLVVVCSGGREGHVCPFGRVEYMTSEDEGATWSWSRVLLDSAIDDRDAGALVTATGTILVTTFSSLAYEPILAKAVREGTWDPARLARWQAVNARLPEALRKEELGVWMLRSTDGGRTWSPRYDSVVGSPHGPIQLGDGRLLYAGKDLYRHDDRIGVSVSTDDGATWTWQAGIPTRPGDRQQDYHELHAVEAADGRIVVQIRNHNKANSGETLQSDSTDGGRTWSAPREIGVWGLPSHLLRLQDGRLLMTYGYRRPPFGNQARVSRDHGQTWSGPIVISGDGAGGDLGYPSTVQLTSGALLTVWYEQMKTTPGSVLRQARWTLDE